MKEEKYKDLISNFLEADFPLNEKSLTKLLTKMRKADFSTISKTYEYNAVSDYVVDDLVDEVYLARVEVGLRDDPGEGGHDRVPVHLEHRPGEPSEALVLVLGPVVVPGP